ncbi:hypothetical protein DFJ74DRAFT_690731 [Hyaloraphidium curvatum]|nr:hypothetical protein DFJ74DRAFT_690731 [Hyaloraphidium curvatum]
MYNFFGGFDNVHIYQLNLKPYGIRLANANGVQNPTLHLEIIPVGSFVNTFSHSGVWYQREYNAKPLAFNPVIEPLNDWSVITPGSLAGYSQALVYMPTPYTRFLVRPRTDAMVAEWDWSGVWGAQIEMWGSFRPTSSLSAGVAAGKMGSCTCPSPSSFKGTGS